MDFYQVELLGGEKVVGKGFEMGYWKEILKEHLRGCGKAHLWDFEKAHTRVQMREGSWEHWTDQRKDAKKAALQDDLMAYGKGYAMAFQMDRRTGSKMDYGKACEMDKMRVSELGIPNETWMEWMKANQKDYKKVAGQDSLILFGKDYGRKIVQDNQKAPVRDDAKMILKVEEMECLMRRMKDHEKYYEKETQIDE